MNEQHSEHSWRERVSARLLHSVSSAFFPFLLLPVLLLLLLLSSLHRPSPPLRLRFIPHYCINLPRSWSSDRLHLPVCLQENEGKTEAGAHAVRLEAHAYLHSLRWMHTRTHTHTQTHTHTHMAVER